MNETTTITKENDAVIGVILNLALIALGAAVALFRYKRNVIHVITACALAGLLLKTLIL